MNGKTSKPNPSARTVRNSRHSEVGGTRLPFVLAIGGTAALLFGFFLFRNPGSLQSAQESASPETPVVTSSPAVVVTKRHVMTPVVRVAPVPERTATTNPPAPTPAQPPPQLAGSSAEA